MKTGAVVVAAGMSSRMKAFKPMLELGGSSIIKKTIETLHAASIENIVVIIGHNAEALKKHLAPDKVTTIKNEQYATGDMFSSACLGLAEMRGQESVIFLPGDIPLFSVETVRALCSNMRQAPCTFISPVFHGKKGHPVLISGDAIEKLLAFGGDGGLKGAMCSLGGEHRLLNVNDKGILLDADRPEDYEKLQLYAAEVMRREKITFHVQLDLIREAPFWNQTLSALLDAIDKTSSINKGCELVGISYTKGWGMIKTAQHRLGIPLLISNTGGVNGGGSMVTAEARMLMEAHTSMQSEMNRYAQTLFQQYFGELFA